MKARFFKKLSFGLALSAMPFVGGCNQASNTPQTLVTAAQAEPLIVTASNDVPPTADLAGPAPSETTPVPVPNAGKSPLPPNIKPSSPVAEIVKLAQSGVDETVMLSYIGNSTSMFSLGSDEIIYLNDIGVANNVVTTIIQHDQALKQSWLDAQNATAQANAQAAQAAAPTYENPPQPEAQPQPPMDAAAPQQPVNVGYNYFNDSLSPYGTWIDVEGYGRCWQPTVVVANRGWQPYCDRGRWLYTDAGWYWNSDYSWGATAFHYGRWFNHSQWGWCWYPDTVWAPSWVSWRYSNAYCGWAPLPPAACYQPGVGFSYHNSTVGVSFGFGLSANCYTFVSWGNFCDSHPWHHRVPAGHVTQIYNNTTIVNNYGSGNHNTVINRGVPMDQVRRHTGTEIRQVAIRDAGNALDRPTRGERLERDGRTLVVHRPNVSQGPAITATPTRGASNVQLGHRPPAGTGVAAQTEVPRGRGREQIETTRNPTITQPPSVVSGNTRTTPSTARPVAGSSGNTLRSRDEQSNTLTRDRSRDNNRSATTPSLIVRGGQSAGSTPPAPTTQGRTTLNPPPTQKAPPGSLVVIGQRDPNSNPGQGRSSNNDRRSTTPRSTQAWSPMQPASPGQSYAIAPQAQSQTHRASAPRSDESLAFNRPSTPTPRVERQEMSRQVAPPPRTYSAPVQAAPSPRVQSVAPTYSAPRSAPAPTPSSTPAPSRSSSSDARPSSSGGGGGSRRGQ